MSTRRQKTAVNKLRRATRRFILNVEGARPPSPSFALIWPHVEAEIARLRKEGAK